MAEHPTRTGGCMCGDVRYQVSGPMKQIVACHCRECRRMTGHFLISADVWNADFDFIEKRGLGWYRSSAKGRRGFCKTCGSSLFFQVDGDDRISIAVGSLDDGCDTGLRIAAHVFAPEKGTYYDLDDAPAFPESTDTVPMPERN